MYRRGLAERARGDERRSFSHLVIRFNYQINPRSERLWAILRSGRTRASLANKSSTVRAELRGLPYEPAVSLLRFHTWVNC